MKLVQFWAISLSALVIPATCNAQMRWPSMPGYKELQEANQARRDLPNLNPRISWTTNSEFNYSTSKGSFKYNVNTGVSTPVEMNLQPEPFPVPQQGPGRGRQWTQVTSPTGNAKAEYRAGNVYVTVGETEKAITTDGSDAKRIRYGTASWVYGEELNQNHAMGFSPDGKFLWYYRFDDNPVKDFYLTLGQNSTQSSLAIEAYPKPGTKNPIVDLLVYNLQTGQSVKVKVREGEFSNALGHYVFGIGFSEDSSRLMFHRMDRQQKIKELVSANPVNGNITVVDREENQKGWTEFFAYSDARSRARLGANGMTFGDELLILSEDSGFFNLYWLDTKPGGKGRKAITQHRFDVINIVKVDTASQKIFYTAGDGATPYRHQFHVINFDGTGHKSLTDPQFHHSVTLSADNKYFVDDFENAKTPPSIQIVEIGSGKTTPVARVADAGPIAGFEPQTWFQFKSLDGTTDLWGTIDKPRNFDPSKKYPILFDIYGGPLGPFGSPSESYSYSSSQASAGFLLVNVYVRDGNGRGRDFRQAIYRKMGIVEIDDFAAGAMALKQFPWADTSRVGIYGTSYGGYASAMAILRYPDLFHAASASSMVSSWNQYDTTYTERYMDLYENNKEGYDRGSTLTYAKDLKGWLMIYYGTADDNTHPSNSLTLINELQRQRKSFEVQVGVDRGHTGINPERMMEFFVERLVMNR